MCHCASNSNRDQQIPEIDFFKTAFIKRCPQIGKNVSVQMVLLVNEFDFATIRERINSAFTKEAITVLFLVFIDRHFGGRFWSFSFN